MESSTIKRWIEEKKSKNIWTKTWVDRKVNIYKLMALFIFLLRYLVNCLSTGNQCRTVICCAATWNSYRGKLLTLVSHSFDETALIYKQAHFGDGPTIFKTINYAVSLYCVWAERASKAAYFRVWHLFPVATQTM